MNSITPDTIHNLLMELKFAKQDLEFIKTVTIPVENFFLVDCIQTRIENLIKQLTGYLT